MDPRIKKTKRDIRMGLVELLKEIPYEKVTIKLVSEKAMIARPTFYAHYSTIQDILVDYLQDLFDTSSALPYLPKDLSENSLTIYFNWIKGLKEIIDLLYKNNLEGIIYKLNRKNIYDKNLLQPDQLNALSKKSSAYKKYVEMMGGILFAQVISLVEKKWEIDSGDMARAAFKTSNFVVREILNNAEIII